MSAGLSYFWRQFADIVRYYRLYVSNLLPFRHQRLHVLSIEISLRRVSYLDIYFSVFSVLFLILSLEIYITLNISCIKVC